MSLKGAPALKTMMINISRSGTAILVALCLLLLNNCGGGGGGGGSYRYDPGIPEEVTGLSAESGNQLVTLSWEGNSVATSYDIYFISSLAGNSVTKTNGAKINVKTTSQVISGLDNNVKYYFMVTALNSDGEGVESIQVSATPGPFTIATLTGAWYFHTLVSGTGAKWERGKITIDQLGNAVISNFQDSTHYDPENPSTYIDAPAGFTFSLSADGVIHQTGNSAWPEFHGIIGSRVNMMVATFTPGTGSKGITIFQKKRDTDDYSEEDVSGTGSGQNPYHPYLQGNGPTRYAYHQLSSGYSNEWEYSNCKIGQHGGIWLEQYKDIIYWDYGTPTYKVAAKYDYLGKVTSIGVDSDGLVKEYSNYADVKDGIHNIVFTGRMSADKTLIIGVSTHDDGSGGKKQYFLRIMELCFYPVDQALPVYTINDLSGSYKFHELASKTGSGGSVAASWAYGTMTISTSGVTTFPEYFSSSSVSSTSDTFTLSYYPDNGIKAYTDFANFTTPAQDGKSHYYDSQGNPYHTYYDYWSYGRTDQPLAIPISDMYYNEHGTLSYNRDLFVMTRTDSSGYAMVIGLK